jgi:hypothetical protein
MRGLVLSRAQPCCRRKRLPSTARPAGLEAAWISPAVLQESPAHASKMSRCWTRSTPASGSKGRARSVRRPDCNRVRIKPGPLAEGAKVVAKHPSSYRRRSSFIPHTGSRDLTGSLAQSQCANTRHRKRRRRCSHTPRRTEPIATAAGYIVNLAADARARSQIMDREAQRCRDAIETPAKSGKKNRRHVPFTPCSICARNPAESACDAPRTRATTICGKYAGGAAIAANARSAHRAAANAPVRTPSMSPRSGRDPAVEPDVIEQPH